MRKLSLGMIVSLLLLCLAACQPAIDSDALAPLPKAAIEQPDNIAQPAENSIEGHGIAWFEGSVAEAFSLAATTNKPIFMYWGAVWCPPCQEIKHTVFKSPEFIAQTKLFIPIYLDGDTERAQSVGEEFGVKGYPTMIIFSPQGEEVTRIPGGIDISRYNSILLSSLDTLRPTRMLVQLALNSPDLLLATDFRQLAYYSWGQDFEALPAGTDPIMFKQLAEQVSIQDPEASARLYLQYLVMLAAEQDEAETGQKADAAPLFRILATPELIIGTWDYLAYYATNITRVLDLDALALASLQNQWQQAMLDLRHNTRLSTAEQLGGWFPYLAFYFAGDEASATLPAAQVAAIRLDAEKANQMTRNAYARQSVVNQISYLLETAGLKDEAKQLLLAELEKSAAPYYFMSNLAALAEAAGSIDESLEWRLKAYQASTGQATRLQWGVSYVRSLIRLAPQRQDEVSQTALALINELTPHQDADGSIHDIFAGRNFRILRRLNTDLHDWQIAADADLLGNFDARLRSLCSQQSKDSTQRSNCQSLLASDRPQ
jgi:thioredoxin-related protein